MQLHDRLLLSFRFESHVYEGRGAVASPESSGATSTGQVACRTRAEDTLPTKIRAASE